jgi:hypothetical protein
MNKQEDVSSNKIMIEETVNKESNDVEFDELYNKNIPLNFQFKQLNKNINWGCIKGLNLNRIINRTDVATLMTVVDDISRGDISEKGNIFIIYTNFIFIIVFIIFIILILIIDIDPIFEKSVILAQLSTQYLLSCENLLHNRTKVIKKAINAFNNEEEELDFQISKYKAREKALRREKKSLDDLQSQYSEIISNSDPKLEKKISKKIYEDGKKLSLTRREEYELEKSIRLKYSSCSKSNNDNHSNNKQIKSKSNHNKDKSREKKIHKDNNTNIENNGKYNKIISSSNSWQNQDSNKFTQDNKENKTIINTEDVEAFDNELNSTASYDKSFENISTLDNIKSNLDNNNKNNENPEIKISNWSTGNISKPKSINDVIEGKFSIDTDTIVGNNADSTSVRGSIALNSTGMMSVDSLNFGSKNPLNNVVDNDGREVINSVISTNGSVSPSPPPVTTAISGNTVLSDGVATLSKSDEINTNYSNIDTNKPVINNIVNLNKDEGELEDFEDFTFNDSTREDTMKSQNKSVIVDIDIPANITKEYKNNGSKYVSDDDDDDAGSDYFMESKKESILKKKEDNKYVEDDDIFRGMSCNIENNDGIFSIKKINKNIEVNSIDTSADNNGIDGILTGIYVNNSIESQHSLYSRDAGKSEDEPVFGAARKSKSNTSLQSSNNEYDDEYVCL